LRYDPVTRQLVLHIDYSKASPTEP
jgi:hypothetical protein